MDEFSKALAAFVLLHLGISATGARAQIIARIGEGPYRGLFSLASAALLLWMIHGFGVMREDGDADPLNHAYWSPPLLLRPLAYGLIGVGFLFAVAGAMTPGPTFAGFEGSLAKEEPAQGILRVTRHPFLWGVALWGAGHLLVNAALFAPMLFGGVGLMAVYGTRSIDRKGQARNPEGWAKFAAVTSNVPFAAIAQGRNKIVIGEMWWRLLVAAAIFVIVGMFHRQLFGEAVWPGGDRGLIAPWG